MKEIQQTEICRSRHEHVTKFIADLLPLAWPFASHKNSSRSRNNSMFDGFGCHQRSIGHSILVYTPLPFVLVLFQFTMSQLVKAENGSCLQLYKKQRKLHEDMCPSCIFLASKDRVYHKVHNNATVGVCYLLHPHLAPEAVEQDEEGQVNNNNTNNEALVDRPIGRTDLFVAEPSNNAEMHKNRTIHPHPRING
jgi:hypothetical protein